LVLLYTRLGYYLAGVRFLFLLFFFLYFFFRSLEKQSEICIIRNSCYRSKGNTLYYWLTQKFQNSTFNVFSQAAIYLYLLILFRRLPVETFVFDEIRMVLFSILGADPDPCPGADIGGAPAPFVPWMWT